MLLARSCKARRVQRNRDAGDGGCSAGTSGRGTADMDFSPPSALWGFTSEGVFVPGASQIPAKSELGTRFWELRNTMVAPGHVSHPSGTSLQWEPTNHHIQPPHPTIASSHRVQPLHPATTCNHNVQPPHHAQTWHLSRKPNFPPFYWTTAGLNKLRTKTKVR